jgi:hypothetical protein
MTTQPAPSASQRTRQARTIPTARRHGQPWTEAEDQDLATCTTDDDLEAFALRWGRRFASVEQRCRRPRTSPSTMCTGTGTGTGWIK